MAATDKIQVFMTQNGDRFWTNVFHVNALTIDAAAAFANTVIVPVLATPMDGLFRVVKTLVSHIGDDSFVSTPMSIPGGAFGAAHLPLFNTIKMTITVDGHGRNDYKFLRAVVLEPNQTNGQIEAATQTAFNTAWNGLIADGTAAGVDLVDSDGNLWLVASCQAAVQMRQLHRKRKRAVVTP
jgi:hypothetical protein